MLNQDIDVEGQVVLTVLKAEIWAMGVLYAV